jgi:hypothetical protein
MRWVVWMGVVGWTVLSCARSQSHPGLGAGGAGSGGTSSGRSGDAGGPRDGGGASGRGAVGGRAGSSSTGGKAGNGGTAGEGATAGAHAGASGGGNVAGVGGATAGHSGTAGADGGDAGEGGAPNASCGAYVACGCGCCANTLPGTSCFYPALGDDLDAIIAADEAAASDPGCASAGCSLGVRRVCCETPDEPGEATYGARGYIGGVNRLTIKRTGADGRCTALALVQPMADNDGLEVTLPDGWAVESATDYACVDENSAASDSRRRAIGGLGTLEFAGPSDCAVDLDLTLFFATQDGEVDAVRFFGNDVVVPEFSSGDCP